jgi:general secretion pathway protein I
MRRFDVSIRRTCQTIDVDPARCLHCERVEREGEAGFALTEILVALSILSLVCAGLLSLLSDSTVRLRDAQALSAATVTAQSLLAQVGRELPLLPGERTGANEHDQPWRLRVERFGDWIDRKDSLVAGYQVFIEVRWKAGRHPQYLTLTGLRIGPNVVSP